MTNVRLKLVVGAGLALGAVAIVVTLAQAPITVARINSSQNTFIAGFRERTSICQSAKRSPVKPLRSVCAPMPSSARGSRSACSPTGA